MADRITEIKTISDELIRRIDNWAKDDHAAAPVPDDIALLIQEADLVCHSGDIPMSCRILVIAVSRMTEEQRKYDKHEADSRTADNGPVSSWWASAKAVLKARQGAEAPLIPRNESVKELLRQNVSRMQIAGSIYGRRGEGPLMQDNGVPDDALIDQEAETPGSVLTGWPDWVPPWQQVFVSEAKERLESQLASLDRRENGRKKYVDPGTIESMLRDRCYVQQIMKGKGVSRQEVLDVAEELEIEAVDQPGWVPEPVEMDSDSPAPHGLESLAAKAELSEKIVAIWEGSNRQFGSAEILDELKKQGITNLTSRQVGLTVAHARRKATEMAVTE